jgi:hypothetical protein
MGSCPVTLASLVTVTGGQIGVTANAVAVPENAFAVLYHAADVLYNAAACRGARRIRAYGVKTHRLHIKYLQVRCCQHDIARLRPYCTHSPFSLYVALGIRGSKGDEPDADGNPFNVCARGVIRCVVQGDLPCADAVPWGYHAKRTCEGGFEAAPAGLCIHDLVSVQGQGGGHGFGMVGVLFIGPPWTVRTPPWEWVSRRDGPAEDGVPPLCHKQPSPVAWHRVQCMRLGIRGGVMVRHAV